MATVESETFYECREVRSNIKKKSIREYVSRKSVKLLDLECRRENLLFDLFSERLWLVFLIYVYWPSFG